MSVMLIMLPNRLNVASTSGPQDSREDVQFTLATYASIYVTYLDSLRRFDERTAPYKLLEKIRINLHDTARYVPPTSHKLGLT